MVLTNLRRRRKSGFRHIDGDGCVDCKVLGMQDEEQVLHPLPNAQNQKTYSLVPTPQRPEAETVNLENVVIQRAGYADWELGTEF